MELKVIEKDKTRIKLEVGGEDHTFCNLLVGELWDDKDTEIVGYSVKHSLVDQPELTFESKKDVIKAFNEAIKRLHQKNKDFLSSFKKIK